MPRFGKMEDQLKGARRGFTRSRDDDDLYDESDIHGPGSAKRRRTISQDEGETSRVTENVQTSGDALTSMEDEESEMEEYDSLDYGRIRILSKNVLEENGYTVHRFLGQGGFGCVYACTNPEGKPVAAKVVIGDKRTISTEVGASEDVSKMKPLGKSYFRNLAEDLGEPDLEENFAKALKRSFGEKTELRLPSLEDFEQKMVIPKVRVVRDLPESKGKVAIIETRLMDGDMFGKYFNTIEEAKKMTVSILKALKFLHSHGRVHFDIKPENVFTAIFTGEKFKNGALADFGLVLPIGPGNYIHFPKVPEFRVRGYEASNAQSSIKLSDASEKQILDLLDGMNQSQWSAFIDGFLENGENLVSRLRGTPTFLAPEIRAIRADFMGSFMTFKKWAEKDGLGDKKPSEVSAVLKEYIVKILVYLSRIGKPADIYSLGVSIKDMMHSSIEGTKRSLTDGWWEGFKKRIKSLIWGEQKTDYDDYIDLLDEMTDDDPKKRPTVDQCLNHSSLKGFS